MRRDDHQRPNPASAYQDDYDYPSPSAYIPATQSRRRGGYGQAWSQGTASARDDHRGRITSVLSLFLSLVIVALSFGGFLLPPIMLRGETSSDAITTFAYIALGYVPILVALLMQAPTILLALRSVSTPRGHVGRGRGLVSVILSCVFPVTCLALLSVFAIGQVNSAIARGVLPQVVTGSDGKPRLVLPEGMDSELGDIVGQVNELAEEGYSVGMDADGNLVATDPDGRQVTITPEDLAEIGL